MNRLILVFIFQLFISCLIGQNIKFSFDAIDNNDNTTTVNIYCQIESGSETIYGYDFALFYDNTLTDATAFSDAPLGWNFDGTFTGFNSNGSQSGFNGYTQLSRFDINGAGTTIVDTDGPVLLGTITFTHITTPAGNGFIADSGILGGLVYASLSGDMEHPIVTTDILTQPLPITLRSFTAKKYGKEDALLQWTSSTEVNSSHYEIERSVDNHNWERIGTVKAAGNSTSDLNYEYIDANLPLNRDLTVFYYRLKMVDTDNLFEYSDVRKISFDIIENTTVKVYPNPAHQSVSVSTLTSQVLDQNATAMIFDVNGKLILEREISENGINTIDISGIPADIYFMHITVGTEKYIEKLIVIK
jgi:hypothetical protein